MGPYKFFKNIFLISSHNETVKCQGASYIFYPTYIAIAAEFLEMSGMCRNWVTYGRLDGED